MVKNHVFCGLFMLMVFLILAFLNVCYCFNSNFKELKLTEHMHIDLDDGDVYLVCVQKPIFNQLTYYLWGDYILDIEFESIYSNTIDHSFKVIFGVTKENALDNIQRSKKKFSFSGQSFFPILSMFQLSKNLNNQHYVKSHFGKLSINLTPFPTSCFGLYDFQYSAVKPKSLIINATLSYDTTRIIQLFMGLFLFLFAKSLSASIVFYYFSGISVVVFSSLLLIILLFTKLVPVQRSGIILQVLVLFLGGTLSLFIILMDYVRSTIVHLILSNTEVVVGYVSLISVLSFIILYWLQLPDKLIINYPRTVYIMSSFLRFFGSLLISYSMHIPSQEMFDFLILFFEGYFNLSPVAVFIETARKFSDFIIRFFLMFILVILLHFISPVFTYTTIRDSLIYNGTKKTSVAHLPGSPWATSSPFQYVHNDGLHSFNNVKNVNSGAKRYSYIKTNIDKSWNLSPGVHRIEKRKSLLCSNKSVAPRDDVITDDETD